MIELKLIQQNKSMDQQQQQNYLWLKEKSRVF